ncbi:MAG: TylF/MycF/NovP-related O-methyltransferase [Candidatus Binatia bacterium]
MNPFFENLSKQARRLIYPHETSGEKSIRELDEKPIELTSESRRLIDFVVNQGLSMTSENNLVATAMACQHVIEQDIAGDFIECGTWRGGHAIIAAGIFAQADPVRYIHVFDTFAGMTEPTLEDKRTYDGLEALGVFKAKSTNGGSDWCLAGIEEVKENFAKANVPTDRTCFYQGKVEQTLSSAENTAALQERGLAVVRLDTDWYESTKVEMEVLWPILSAGGIMVIDDYGYWQGAKKAVDEYFGNPQPFMSPIDRFARLMVKPKDL